MDINGILISSEKALDIIKKVRDLYGNTFSDILRQPAIVELTESTESIRKSIGCDFYISCIRFDYYDSIFVTTFSIG